MEGLLYLGRCSNRHLHHRHNHRRHFQTVNKWLRIPSAKVCETVRPVISFKPKTATQKDSAHTGGLFLIWPRGCGRIGGGFSGTCLSAEGSWEGLGSGNRRRRFLVGLPRFLQTRGCAKQKSLQHPPTIRCTDSVCVLRTKMLIFFRFGGGGGGCGGDLNISPNTAICPK